MKTLIAAGFALVAVACGASTEPSPTGGSTAEPTPTVPAALLCTAESGRFVPQGAAVVDTADGKMWQREVSPWQRTQIESIAYCQALELERRTDWRVPEVRELTKIRVMPGLTKGGDRGTCVPSIDQSAFPDTPPAEFWTSSMKGTTNGIYTDFADGRSHPSDANTQFYVRCVHDADVTAFGTLSAVAPQ